MAYTYHDNGEGRILLSTASQRALGRAGPAAHRPGHDARANVCGITAGEPACAHMNADGAHAQTVKTMRARARFACSSRVILSAPNCISSRSCCVRTWVRACQRAGRRTDFREKEGASGLMEMESGSGGEGRGGVRHRLLIQSSSKRLRA